MNVPGVSLLHSVQIHMWGGEATTKTLVGKGMSQQGLVDQSIGSTVVS